MKLNITTFSVFTSVFSDLLDFPLLCIFFRDYLQFNLVYSLYHLEAIRRPLTTFSIIPVFVAQRIIPVVLLPSRIYRYLFFKENWRVQFLLIKFHLFTLFWFQFIDSMLAFFSLVLFQTIFERLRCVDVLLFESPHVWSQPWVWRRQFRFERVGELV